jgi:glycolate oxidase FAD binding subunit
VTPIEMLGLTGIVDYDPEEFTITALAGTLLAELETSLAEHGQYLPFDPPLVRAGATVGGAIAAGLSGSGRWRYGGLRDFVLQVRYVDGSGTLVRGGAKVVKNAAGFELPRLMAGSLGRLGVLGEATFKVLPSAEARATVRIEHETLEGAMAAMGRLAVAPLELEALDLEPLPIPIVWARVGGIAEALQRRLARVIGVAEDDGSSVRHDMLDADAEHRLWADAREFAWVPDGWALLDVPLAPANVPALEGALGGLDARRRYCAGGNLGLLACRLHDLPGLEERLSACGLGALRVWGPTGASLVGVREHAFGARVKAALDPLGRFPEH